MYFDYTGYEIMRVDTMKRTFFIIWLLAAVFLSANPIWVGAIPSELYFDESGDWVLEIYQEIHGMPPDSIFLHSSDGMAKITQYDTTRYFIVTKDSLDRPLDINRSGDYLSIYYYVSGYSMTDSIVFGDYPGSTVYNFRQGQSINSWIGTSICYKDNSPTLGYENDYAGALGKIYGYMYNKDQEPVAKRNFRIYYGSQGFIETDELGFFEGNLLARTYVINELFLFDSTSHVEKVTFQERVFDIEEGDSLRVDFIQAPASTEGRPQFAMPFAITLKSYPNPARNTTTLSIDPCEDNLSGLSLFVYNIRGQRVDVLTPRSGIFPYDCAHLSQGVYLLVLNRASRIVSTHKLQIIK